MLRFRLGIFVVSDIAKVKSIKVEDFKPIFGHQGASAATRSIENSDSRVLAILRKDTNGPRLELATVIRPHPPLKMATYLDSRVNKGSKFVDS